METKTNLPIDHYGLIGNCQSAAIISKYGSIDWCCMPTIDSPSCFDKLLDWENGGCFKITPSKPFVASHQYLNKTMILETYFKNDDGEVRLRDFFSMETICKDHPHQHLIRIVECLRGKMDLEIIIAPRFDYGDITPCIRDYKTANIFRVFGGQQGLLISGNIPLKHQPHRLNSEITIKAGEKFYFSIIYVRPEKLDRGSFIVPDFKEIENHFQLTYEWWHSWISQGDFSKTIEPGLVERSVLVLKCLSNYITGAIVAAPTMSLPEVIGGERNWDYRYSWIRDSAFTMIALSEIGFKQESDDFYRFIKRSSAGNAKELQIVYGSDGRRRLLEFKLNLPGYLNSSPVLIGNNAHAQYQFDVYGEILIMVWRLHKRGYSPDETDWQFLHSIINSAAENWSKPDSGIWEFR